MRKHSVVIGSGFAGLSAACFLAKAGWQVTVIEQHSIPGGRARIFEEQGFRFDMGPSWYWMPDIFERFFGCFGKKVSDYYMLERLDPSYRVYFSDGPFDVPANFTSLKAAFDSIELGSGARLETFLEEAAYKYEVGMHRLAFKPGQSITEFLDAGFLKGIFRLDVLKSMKKHVASFFTHPKLVQLMEFPVLFLGALPENTPALYSLMNYADVHGGTWYPQGGMYSIVDAMYRLALELGVEFRFGEKVTSIQVRDGKAEVVHVIANDGKTARYTPDALIGAADYHHIETSLLPNYARRYSASYWNSRVMAPGCLLYYVGLNKRIDGIRHHSLFFDTEFSVHGAEIYKDPQWPSDPLFYVCAPSVTDPSVAPEGCENLFLLIPVASGLQNDSTELRTHYFDRIIARIEAHTGQPIRDSVIFMRSFAQADFESEYNAFKGNAYGLANTLSQTAMLKPGGRSRKVKNLFYAGQLTVPGPGVPPSLVSGEIAATQVTKRFG